MAVRDRIKTTTTSTGSPFTLSTTPPTGYFAFDRFTNSDANIPVAIVQQDGAKWQVCFCTITNSGATLTVNTVVMTHNNNTTPVTFDAGTKDVFVAPIASAVAMLRENNTFTGTNTFPNTGLKVQDTDASHVLTLASGALTADRTLTLTTGSAADRTLDISAANVTISTAGAALIDDASTNAQQATLGMFDCVKAFSNQIDVEGTTIDSTIDHIRTAGYYQAGDGGGALYKKVSGTPTSGVGTKYIESSGGQRWEYSPDTEINAKAYGLKADNSTTETTILQAVLDAANTSNVVILPQGTIISGPLTISVKDLILVRGQ